MKGGYPAELPWRPPLLEDVAFLSAFIGPGRRLPIDQPNGSGWCLRAYRSVDGLVALGAPATSSRIRPFPMRPRPPEEDFPCRDDVPEDLVDEFDAGRDECPDALPNRDGFKIGGWPTLIQGGRLSWMADEARPEFAFQVDSDAKAHWAWGDSGVGYFGRGTAERGRDVWTLDWQCY